MAWKSPPGLTRREAHTIFLRAPHQDWAALVVGQKTEFRVGTMGARMSKLQTPTPVVLYAGKPDNRKTKLMVLEEYRREQLIDIAENPESLRREGFETFPDFIRYWRVRNRRGWRGLDEVEAFRVGPLGSEAELELGLMIFGRLYGDFLHQ